MTLLPAGRHGRPVHHGRGEVMVVPVLLLTLGAAAVFFGSRRRPARPPLAAAQASPVSYQHLQLYQGGLISQDALESAKAELSEKFAHGGVTAVETCLRPG